MRRKIVATLLPWLLTACAAAPEWIPADRFETEVDGVPVHLYTLKNGNIAMQVTNFGARVVSLFTPDAGGRLENIVVGHDNIEDYITPPGERFLGACVGPVANRIGNASFSVDGTEYRMPANDHAHNTLHGGWCGVDMIPWEVVSVNDSSLVLECRHADLQEGFPGNLFITMTYTLTRDDSFRIDYSAVTDKPTPVNLTHHPFFCLRGQGNGSVEDYEMCIHAGRYIPIDAESIPTGEVASVAGTPFDFRDPWRIGARIHQEDIQLQHGNGYDHNWCIDAPTGTVAELGWVRDPQTRRQVTVLSDRRGLQFYSGNFFTGAENGSNGRALTFRSSLALEAQDWPDTPNQPAFGDITLRPGQVYRQTTLYRFSIY